MKLRFFGAAGTVTGSRCLLESCKEKILIDCGLFQGPPELRQKNWDPLPIDAKEIDAVFLTHAHIDHSGYLPRLVKQGFHKKVFTSTGTFELSSILLRDAAYLEEEQAAFTNRTGYSKHRPAQPLFTRDDAEKAIKLFVPQERNTWYERESGLRYRYLRSGHIIGSSFIQFAIPSKCGTPESYETITFSGDVGHGRSFILRPPDFIEQTDYLVLESTYGGRLHSRENIKDKLAEICQKVISRKGCLVIPAFAVGRSQEVLYLLASLEREKKIDSVPVILDSPLSKEATKIFVKNPEDHVLEFGNGGTEKKLFPKKFECIESPDESMMVCMRDGPMIIISAAGMLTGGRILHHLKSRLPDSKNAVLFVGYQAEGSKGRFLQEQGKIEGKIRIHHQEVPVEAEIFTIDQLSSHADPQDMLQWLDHLKAPPKEIILNHGNPNACLEFSKVLKQKFKHSKISIAKEESVV